jgi:hypothetical protein
MSKGFKQLRGKKLLINRPEPKKSAIELSVEEQGHMTMEEMKMWTQLEVYAVGTEVTDIQPGDRVYIYVHSLSSAEVINIDNKPKMLVDLASVAIVW